MADLNDIAIRLDGHVAKSKPAISINSAAFVSFFSPPDGLICTPFSYRFYQASFYKICLSTVSQAMTGSTTTSTVVTPFSYRFYQAAFSNPYMATSTAAWSLTKPDGYREGITRPIVNVVSDVQFFDESIRLIGNTVTPVGGQDSTIVYPDVNYPEDSIIDEVDFVKPFVWWGGEGLDDYVYFEYRDAPTPSNPNPAWRDIFDSQAWVLTNGQDKAGVTFIWDASSDVDESQTLTYELIIAFDFDLQNQFLLKTGIDTNSYSLDPSEYVDADQTYFWAIRAKDSVGDTSAWSTPKSFRTYRGDPPRVELIGGKRRVLIPFRQYHYDWQVGNLENGIYQYRIGIHGGDWIVPESAFRFISVNHDKNNPPEIINVYYDAHNYRLHFDIQIQDSRFRSYDVVSVEFADQTDKVTAPGAVYNVASFDWHTIPSIELIGRRKRLTSNPYISRSATFGWFHNAPRKEQKKYTYDMRLSSSQTEYINDFKWGWRGNYAGGSVGDWEIQSFDRTLQSNFRRPAIAMFGDETKYIQPYYGKANPLDIVMNTAYFTWDRDTALTYDFALFDEDDNIIADSLQNTDKNYARVKPIQFFQLGITNIILDLINIEDEFYELFPQEVDKILEAIPNQNFFWRVRANDEHDTSAWSLPQQSRAFNVHSFEWDVRNSEQFRSSDYVVIKVEIAPSVDVQPFEFPHFNWLNIHNPQIDQYRDQIRALEENKEQVESHLHSYYDSYIYYLEQRIKEVRNAVLNSLIEEGYFDDVSNFQNFIDANVHSQPVMYNDGAYSSQLDIHDEYLERTKDLHNKVNGQYPWSPAYYIWQMDIAGEDFASQEGKPLRSYDIAGMACENEQYKHCYLTTGDINSCPWYGRSDLGFCKGFLVESLRVHSTSGEEIPLVLGGAPNPPDQNADPEAFQQWAQTYDLGSIMASSAAAADTEEEIKLGFDVGACPMAQGYDSPTEAYEGVGPCAKYKRTDKRFHQKRCDICGTRRYPQFVGMQDDLTSKLYEDIYSDLNPAGFASVEIRQGDDQISNWEPIAEAGQSRNPQHRFTALKLTKSQLPGELNSDILNEDNDNGIKDPHFKDGLNAPVDLVVTPGPHRDGWYPLQKSDTSDAQIIEVI